VILTPELLTILIVNSIFFLFATVAFILSIKIFFYWDINKTTRMQYQLERESYLVSTIIKYIFIIKIPLLLFFIFTLDKISNLITGAMCAVGVVNATKYGIYLLIIKIVNIYIFGIWLTIHYLDIKSANLPYTKIKFEFFIVAYMLFALEITLIWDMFSTIDIDKMVSCCGTLFSSNSTSAIGDIIRISQPIALSIFYGSVVLMIFFYKYRVKYLFALLNLLFLSISFITLISFFGTYIYELPTHHCPFCFLQSDYYYIGYLIYTLLFLGSFYGFCTGVMEILGENREKNYIYSILFNLLYTTLVSFYPVIYFIQNGVWL